MLIAKLDLDFHVVRQPTPLILLKHTHTHTHGVRERGKWGGERMNSYTHIYVIVLVTSFSSGN